MLYNMVYIVGDSFNSFACNENILTFSSFVEKLYKKKNKKLFDCVVIGQGLSAIERKIIAFVATQANINLLNESDIYVAGQELTHKHKAENILISSPIKRSNDPVYFAKLLIDDSCAEMSDHVTGQHIQGMILVEAARQMMLAVAEKYILDPESKNNSYCVLLKVNSTFHQFNFPIETTLKHTILDNKYRSGHYIVKTKTEIMQNQNVISFVEIDYIFSNKEVLKQREMGMAKTAIEKNMCDYLDSTELSMSA